MIRGPASPPALPGSTLETQSFRRPRGKTKNAVSARPPLSAQGQLGEQERRLTGKSGTLFPSLIREANLGSDLWGESSPHVGNRTLKGRGRNTEPCSQAWYLSTLVIPFLLCHNPVRNWRAEISENVQPPKNTTKVRWRDSLEALFPWSCLKSDQTQLFPDNIRLRKGKVWQLHCHIFCSLLE